MTIILDGANGITTPSDVTIQSSGGGNFVIQPANSATDRTLTLPDAAGTLDRLERAGNVLQVVQTTTTSRVTTTSTSYVDASGYTASITPSSSSSKVLVVCNLFHGSTSASGIWLKLLRDSTSISDAVGYTGGPSNAAYMTQCTAITHLDSPSTTSSVTYKIQFRSDNGNTMTLGGATNNTYGQGSALNNNSITLLEIAA